MTSSPALPATGAIVRFIDLDEALVTGWVSWVSGGQVTLTTIDGYDLTVEASELADIELEVLR